MTERFPKSARLRTRAEFQRMAKGSKRLYGRLLSIEVKSGYTEESRLGVTSTRRYGKAHDRNRFKRIVREAFRKIRYLFPNIIDLHVKPRVFARSATSTDIIEELKSLLVGVHDKESTSGTAQPGTVEGGSDS